MDDYENHSPSKVVLEAANNGYIRRLPNKYDKYMHSKNSQGRNPVLIYADKQYLSRLPQRFLTSEYLLEEDNSGMTAIHIAAKRNQLQHVPKELLTKENLLKVDSKGFSALDYAVMNRSLRGIPEDTLEQIRQERLVSEQYNLHLRSPEVKPPAGIEVPLGTKGDLKELVKNFYSNPFALGSLQDFVRASVPERNSGSVFLSPTKDPNHPEVYVQTKGGVGLNFSVKSNNQDLGLVDLGTFKKDDILEVITQLQKVIGPKPKLHYDDSPNICLR